MNTIAKLRAPFRKAPFLGWCAVGLLLLAGLLWLFGGVKSGPTVTGTVKVDGKLLDKGSIDFIPVDDKGAIADGRGPGGGENIKEGRYRIEKGLTVGRYWIKIQGTKITPKRVPDPLVPSNLVQEEAAVVPLKYNQNSILFREVGAGPNPIDFELEGIIRKSR
jgi:hypothetical protein